MVHSGAQFHDEVLSSARKSAHDASSTAETSLMVDQIEKFWLTELLTFIKLGLASEFRL
jgi:hypothetical protein